MINAELKVFSVEGIHIVSCYFNQHLQMDHNPENLLVEKMPGVSFGVWSCQFQVLILTEQLPNSTFLTFNYKQWPQKVGLMFRKNLYGFDC